MTRIRLLVCTMALVGLSAPALRAQSESNDRARGVVAYRAMDYESAIRWLQQDLDRRKGELRAEERAELLGYVGASEHWLGRPDSAAQSFRAALRASARFRPDTLIFPHAVWVAFENARQSTEFVEARAVGDSEFKVGQGSAHFRLFASAPHRVRVTLCDERGSRLRGILDGWITDSLMIRWDGRLDSGSEPTSGKLGLCSDANGGATSVRLLDLDVDVRRHSAPTSASVASSTSTATSSAPWMGALGAAAAIAVIPAVVSDGERGTPARFGVSALLLVVALRAAFVQRAPPVATVAGPSEASIVVRATPPSSAERPDAP